MKVPHNWKLYCAEAIGLGIFMISACFFSAILEGDTTLHNALPVAWLRLIIAGVLMGTTALLIFYAPFTSVSGSHINPAVTLCFLRLGRIRIVDALFYILFQVGGGTAAVAIMALLIKTPLTEPPVMYAVTVPLKSLSRVFITELVISFLMMSMILVTSEHQYLKKYTKVISACFVCVYVIAAGPVSGFGMNPARTLASAIPSNIWTGFWIYVLAPVGGMLAATEMYLVIGKRTAASVKHHTDKFEI